ncbi:uncharacterized protein LOC142329028 [Lycorma delicatula]|uniref:uncharacterized protein LOC142329028 n=1 Tax=Lycorma delicatula TaxID=130591 RepID=UPI003F50EDB6
MYLYKMFYLILLNLILIISVECKQFKRCQLARELYWRHKIPEKDLPIWLCITYKSSGYNTDTVDTETGTYGMFQIHKRFCYEHSDEQLENQEKLCKVPCDAFVDYDITDDIACVKKIFIEAKYFTGNGFSAWKLYKKCKGPRSKLYIKGCNYRKRPRRKMKISTQNIVKEATTVKSNNITSVQNQQNSTDFNHEINTSSVIPHLFDVYPACNEETFIVSKKNLSAICSMINNSSSTTAGNNTKNNLTEVSANMVNNENFSEISINKTLKTTLTEGELNTTERISSQNITTESMTYITISSQIIEKIMKNSTQELQTENGVRKKMLVVFNWLYNQIMSM